MPFTPVEHPKCPKCKKSVYAAEEKVAAGQKWHKMCFKCGLCNKLLESTNVAEHEGEVFCKNCHGRKFGIKGYGFGGGAGCLSMDTGAQFGNQDSAHLHHLHRIHQKLERSHHQVCRRDLKPVFGVVICSFFSKMSSTSIVAAFAALFVVAVSGLCPAVPPMANLESTRLSGEWFGVYGNNVGFQAPAIRCLKGDFQANDAGIFTTSIEFIKSSNDRITKSAVGTPIDNNKAKLHFVNTINPAKTEDTTILDTDYDHYMVWVTCMNRDGQSGYNVAVTSRQTTLAANLLDRVKEALRSANLDDTLVQVSHANC